MEDFFKKILSPTQNTRTLFPMEIDFLAKSHLAFCGAALEHQAKQLELAFAWVSIYPIKCKDKRERKRCGERGGNPLLLWISRDNLWLLYRVQGLWKFWKPKGVNSNVMGTGKSFWEVLILASTNPHYDKRLSSELPVQYMKILCSKHGENTRRTCCLHKLF